MGDFSDHVDSSANNRISLFSMSWPFPFLLSLLCPSLFYIPPLCLCLWIKNRDVCEKVFLYLCTFSVVQLFVVYFHETLEYIMKRIGNMIFPQVLKQPKERVDLHTLLEEGGGELTSER